MEKLLPEVVPFFNGWMVHEDWRPDTLVVFSDQQEACLYAHRLLQKMQNTS